MHHQETLSLLTEIKTLMLFKFKSTCILKKLIAI